MQEVKKQQVIDPWLRENLQPAESVVLTGYTLEDYVAYVTEFGWLSGFTFDGFVRDVCKNVPPVRSTVRTDCFSSGTAHSQFWRSSPGL